MNKVLVTLSGGVDSLVCLALAIKKYGIDNVETISFNYGQKNANELKAVKRIAKHYGVYNKIIYLKNLFFYEKCSLLNISKNDIPLEDYNEQIKQVRENKRVSTNVPFRNAIMLSVCVSYAMSKNINIIYYGIHNEGELARDLYPDCSEEFNDAFKLLTSIGSEKTVKIVAPLVDLTKKEIIKIGIKLNVPFSKTWTCYNNKDFSCGKCTACKDRLETFKKCKLEDPLIYKEQI